VFLMTCLRTAFHEGTKLLTVLEFPFRVRPPTKLLPQLIPKHGSLGSPCPRLPSPGDRRHLLDHPTHSKDPLRG
jgi:hypothetical protein